MIKRILLGLIAISAVATAVCVAVVAAAFALYALMAESVGAPGAAAIVAGVAAVVVAVVGLIAGLEARSHHHAAQPRGLADDLLDIVKQRPLLAAGGALAAGILALKNPQAAAGLVSAFLAGKAADHNDRRRR